MKVLSTIAAGVFLGSFAASCWAVSPCVERPTPPPCCADGQCIASPASFGYYDTRWRRWPLESLAQAAPQKPASITAPLQKEFGPFVVPPPEREGDKAPPPSTPVGEQTPAAGGPPRGPGAPSGPGAQPGQQGPTGPGTPTGPSRGTPGYPSTGFPAPPSAAPGGPAATPSTQPLYKSVSPDSPLNRSGSSPMGDADPPPALPYGPALVAPTQPSHEISQQPAAVPRQAPAEQPADAPANDPPPAPPIALASYTE